MYTGQLMVLLLVKQLITSNNMELSELKTKVREHQYMEDDTIIDASLAVMIANRLQLSDPVWLVIVGASSGGKSQMLRPLAMTDSKFIHRVDDVTENTFLSAAKLGKNEDGTERNPSLLLRIGALGMIVISDLTVIFSKNNEARTTILSQLRMIYDGEMSKIAGNMEFPIKWRGYLGIMAGCTPSAYRFFEEASDMGERFICWRMKDFDSKMATKLALSTKLKSKEIDEQLSELYGNYIKETVLRHTENESTLYISPEVVERLTEIATFAELIRTPVHTSHKTEEMDRLPVPAMPMRLAKQLAAIAKGLMIMRNRPLEESDYKILDWFAYSLANEEKRAILRTICNQSWGSSMTTRKIADAIGLNTAVTRNLLQNLASVNVLSRRSSYTIQGDQEKEGELSWSFAEPRYHSIVQRIEGVHHYSSDEF